MKNSIKCLLLGLLTMSLASCGAGGGYANLKGGDGGNNYYPQGGEQHNYETPTGAQSAAPMMSGDTGIEIIENPYFCVCGF